MTDKITVTIAKNLEPRSARYDVFDSEQKGFGIRVYPSGHKSYFFIYQIDGRKRRFTIGDAASVKLQQARDIVTIKAGEVARGEDPGEVRKRKRKEQQKAKSRTVGGFFEFEYLPWLLTERKSGKATGERLKSCFEWLFNKPMTDVVPFLLKGWCKKRLDAGRSPHTVNRDLVALKAMLSKAVEWSLLEKSPLAGMKKLKAEDNERVRYLSPDEAKRLFEALDIRETDGRAARTRFNEWRRQRHLKPFSDIAENEFIDHLQPLVVLALNTGMRRGEMFNLLWSDINTSNNLLTVRSAAAKTAKIRHIPLNAKARDVLKCWKSQTSDTGLIFPGEEGERLDNVKTSWGNLREKAELVDFRFHDLRHDFATKTLKAGADIVTLSKLLGHKNLEMTLRYAHVTDDALAAAVEGI